MPWEVTIVNAQDRQRPLGTREDVIARFAAALPGVLLQPAPRPPPDIVAQMPEVLREHFLRPPLLNAELDADDYRIHFYTTDQPQIDSVGAEVRGNGNPMAALAAICQPNGWALINDADGQPIDLSSTNADEFTKFKTWRDKAVGSIKNA